LPFKNGEIAERLRCVTFQAFSIWLMTKQSPSRGPFIADILPFHGTLWPLLIWGGTSQLQFLNIIRILVCPDSGRVLLHIWTVVLECMLEIICTWYYDLEYICTAYIVHSLCVRSLWAVISQTLVDQLINYIFCWFFLFLITFDNRLITIPFFVLVFIKSLSYHPTHLVFDLQE